MSKKKSKKKYMIPCIKCGKAYQTNDPDPYYCKTCLKEKNKIAKEIDAKIKNRPSDRKGQSFEDKVSKMKTINGIPMINL